MGATARSAQYFTALSAVLAIVSCGANFAWPSPALAKIEPELGFSLTPSESSWIVSVVNLSAMLGSILGGLLVDVVGRKLCVLSTCLPYALSWLLIFLATSPAYLLAARLVSGAAVGMALSVVPVYLGEVASAKLRGEIGVLTGVSMNFGVLLEYAVGPNLTLQWLSAVSAVVPVLCFATFVFMPESPYYLVMKGDMRGARDAVERLRDPQDVDAELKVIVTAVEEQARERLPFLEAVSAHTNRRALAVVFVLAFMQQVTGIGAILAYFEELYEESSVPMSLTVASVVVALVQIAGCAASSSVVDRVGRRPLFLGSLGAAVLVHAAMGAFFFCKESLSVDVTAAGSVPIVLVMLYLLAYGMALGPLVFVLIGEMLAQNVKAFGATGAGVFISLGAFVSTKAYPLMKEAYGTYTPFWVFSAFALFTFVFCAVAVPETKGKTLAEIQDMLRGGQHERGGNVHVASEESKLPESGPAPEPAPPV